MDKLKLKEAIDSILYFIYNLLSQILFLLNVKTRKLVRQNNTLKNKHTGQRCFILATGPSLNSCNLEALKEETVFGVNFLYKGDTLKIITPTYYCLYDNIFYQSHQETMKGIMELLPTTTFIVRTNAYKAIKRLKLSNHNVIYQHCKYFQYGDKIKIDMTKNMTAPYNVVLGCIQTAMYMGFKEIYLLGCDFNSFASLKNEHFYDDKGSSPQRTMSIGYELKFYSMVSYHHYALEKYARRNGILIYNLTPNSLLDAYERKDLTEVI